MATTREAVYAALFSRFQTKVTLCKRFERKWFEAQQIPIEQQPALLCLEAQDIPEQLADPTQNTVMLLEASVVIYARTNDTPTPGTVLSNILDQLQAALVLQPGEPWAQERVHTNLGIPEVQYAWISGAVDKEDGAVTGGQAWMHMNVQILVVP